MGTTKDVRQTPVISYRSLVMTGLLTLGLLGSAPSAQAKSHYFNTYRHNNQKVHKRYTSKKSYNFNKTFTFAHHDKLKMSHVYVYQVAKKDSKYRTWVKITGTASNQGSHGKFRFGRDSLNGLTTAGIAGFTDTTLNFTFSPATSKSPRMLSTVTNPQNVTSNGLAPHKSEHFELLLHAKQPVKKLGKVTFHVRVATPGQLYQGQSSLNLN